MLLYDPAGQHGWEGQFRVIGYVRAELEPEMAADPLIGAGGLELADRGTGRPDSGYRKISGTVTRW